MPMPSNPAPRVNRISKSSSFDESKINPSSTYNPSSWPRQQQRILGIVLLIIIIGGAYLLFDRTAKKNGIDAPEAATGQTNQTPLTQSTGNSQLQVTSATDAVTAELVQTVFKHIFLPSGNVQVATVVKPDELRKVNPIFYQFAKEGDKVLIYADRAILYDPVADKVLDVIHGPSQPTK